MTASILFDSVADNLAPDTLREDAGREPSEPLIKE